MPDHRYFYHRKRAGRHNFIHMMVKIVAVIAAMSTIFLLYSNYMEQKEKSAELKAEAEAVKSEQELEFNRLNDLVNSVKSAVNTYMPGVICWGDSLTTGAGGDGVTYPQVLEELIKENIIASFDLSKIVNPSYRYLTASAQLESLTEIPVINMGVGGETTDTILGRNGAVPFVVSESFTIPEDDTKTEIQFTSQNGDKVAPLRQGDRGMESVIINGVKGVISIEQRSYMSKNFKYFFTRFNSGEPVKVEKGTVIRSAASTSYEDYILVLFIGQNGGYDNVEELIEQQQAMIDNQKENNDRFIIVGLHSGTKESRSVMEAAMEDVWGSHYINLREYMSTKALKDAGIKMTNEDRELMAVGSTPKSLLSDEVHFNSKGYELLGKLIYQRMDSLGYFDEIKNSISKAVQTTDSAE